MAIVRLRNKRNKRVAYLSDAYLRNFPETWELADQPEPEAAVSGLPSSDLHPVEVEVSASPAPSQSAPGGKAKKGA